MKVETVVGVDFSGGKHAGRAIWLATAEVGPRLKLRALQRLETLAGTRDRDPALAHLVDVIAESQRALWGMDFPFGLPVEMASDGWPAQLAAIAAWEDGAQEYGRMLYKRSLAEQGKGHVRRTTDVLTKTPFDCYHYRIIYQTFHGMRDVLRPLRGTPRTAILPFEPATPADRIVVETCPSSTLKRLDLPHQNYKQPGGKPVDDKRRATRRAIFAGLKGLIDIPPHQRRKAMTDPGGDALDAIIAAVGSWHGYKTADHDEVAGHERAAREGWIYA
ncbi:MAG: DUF429 domain-containing protein [Planctomycetota bacterium]